MAKKPDGSKNVTALRGQAEARLRATKRDVAAMPVKDVQQLVHELQVHQIELEMQNEELRRTQIELETARDRYVDLYDFSPAGHLTLDTQGTIVEANLRVGTLLGLNRKKLIGQPLARFIAPSDADTFHRHCQEVLKTGTRQTCEVLLGKEAGVSRWIYLESLALHDETGLITHWRTALLDISDRKLAEQELEDQRAQLEKIIGPTKDAIITVDEGERVVLFDRAAESMFLCPAADAVGQPFDRFIPERFRQTPHGHLNVLFRKHADIPFDGRIRHVVRPASQWRGISLRGVHLSYPDRQARSSYRHSARYHRAEECGGATEASEAFVRAVLNSLPLHICVLDGTG